MFLPILRHTVPVLDDLLRIRTYVCMYVPCINVCGFYRLGPVFTYFVMVMMLFVCSG